MYASMLFTIPFPGKKGPIYAVEWNPNSEEFCAVYGCILLVNPDCEGLIIFAYACTCMYKLESAREREGR